MKGMEVNASLKGRTVLLVEDDPRLSKRLQALLAQEEAVVHAAQTIKEGRAAWGGAAFDFVLLDVHLPDGSGLELLREHRPDPDTAVVVMTADGGMDSAIQALRHGAADYLVKPFNPFELPLVYARCKERMDEHRRQSHERRQGALRDAAFHFGQGLDAVREQLERILETDRRLDGPLPPVLLLGETGTGKTTLARMIHEQGPRADQPFIEINCSALPENLIEAELFGHERGAFTDAREARIGLFEAAGNGTLLLDEVSSLPLSAQAKILTAIERRVIRRVGSSRELGVNARIIAASLENLERKSAEQAFRVDLYHRLHVLGIEIPPLRSRPSDVVPLARHLLAVLRKRYRAPQARITERGEERITAYAWPGNVRELDHEIERQLVLSGGGDLEFSTLSETGRAHLVSSDDWLNPEWRVPEDGFSIEDAMHRLIKVALDQSGGNLSAAARLLGVNRDYIRYRLAKKGTRPH